MPKLIILKGLPASGKSTWAKSQVEADPTLVRVNKDDIRRATAKPWSRELEREVIITRDFKISEALRAGRSVISDDTNLAPKHEKRLREIAKEFGAEVEVNETFLSVPIEECIRRDVLRASTERVGEKVIRGMAETMLPPPPAQAYFDSPLLPRTVICDLDGTLALFNGLRGPFEYHKCSVDRVNDPVRRLITNYKALGYAITYLSGREDSARDLTAEWLRLNLCPEGSLFMRASGDFRKDSTVKREIFDREILGKFSVEFCLDDRDQVVELWRSMGLTCFQVAYGNF